MNVDVIAEKRIDICSSRKSHVKAILKVKVNVSMIAK